MHGSSTATAAATATLLLAAACGGEDTGEETLDRMSEEHEGDRPVEAAAGMGEAPDDVQGREVTYATVDGREVTGYLATPEDAADDAPGVIVIHEWWGLNDNIRTMAEKLAGEGYAALAVDLYRGDVASTPDSAGQLAGSVDEEQASSNLEQAHDWLEERGARRIGAIGWCFGGGWSLRTALLHPDELDAAVIYYGRVTDDASELEPLGMPVQGHFGSEDGSIPPEDARAFEQALNDAGVPNEIYVYEGAGHAFANPSGERYQPEAAERAWQRTTRFLAEHLKGEGSMGSEAGGDMAYGG
jgi:carboxymethylenebutenolidase